MTTKRAAIFDVDGTLVDSNHLHVVTWWEAFRKADRHAPMWEIRRAVGLGSGNLIEHLLGDDRGPDGDDPLAATHHALYATYFERLPALDEAGDLLRALAGRGWKIVLAASASGAELSAPRGAIDADDVILGAASADDVDDGRPAPDPARQAGELAGVPSERAVFVGDTVWDMKAAVRDGGGPRGVLYGVADRRPRGLDDAAFHCSAPLRQPRHPELRPRAPGDGVGTDRLRVLGDRTAAKAAPTTRRDGSMTQRVSDVMNKAPGTVEPQTSVAVVARVMRDEDVGAVLVAEGERLRGLPTRAATIWSR